MAAVLEVTPWQREARRLMAQVLPSADWRYEEVDGGIEVLGLCPDDVHFVLVFEDGDTVGVSLHLAATQEPMDFHWTDTMAEAVGVAARWLAEAAS
jgi:hypothetical protein